MIRPLLRRIQGTAFERPGTVVAVSLVAVLVALALGSRVEFRKSRSELAPAGDPDQERWGRLLDEYEGTEALIACVEAEPGGPAVGDDDRLRAFVTRLAETVARDERVARVFYRVDRDWFLDRGLYLVPPEDLDRWIGVLDERRETLARLDEADGFPGINRLLAEQLARSMREASSPGDADLDPILSYLDAQNRFLDAPRTAVDSWTERSFREILAERAGDDGSDGWLRTYDARTYFVLITPAGKDDSLEFRRGLLADLYDRVGELGASTPGYRVVFTGQPAMVVEEMDSVRRDTLTTSVFAIVGVALLTWFVFRWRTHVWLVLGALGAGIAWSFGAVWVELGYLNMITSSFISTLVGIGVAYGIHPVSEYELEGAHTKDPVRAARNAFLYTGPGVTVAAVTTSVAFLSIQLMRFRGFSELGLVAGVGVLLCWIAAAWTLPAMLVLYGRRRARRRRTVADGARGRSAVDRIWVERLAAVVCRAPRVVTVSAIVWTLVSAGLVSGIGFDTNILDLLPSDAPSLTYQRRMAMDSRLSPLYNIVVADDVAGLREFRERAANEPTIDRFESALEFLPADPAAVERRVERLAELLDGVDLPSEAGRPTPADWAASCEALENAFLDALETAFAAGLADLVEPLDRASAAAAECADRARDADPARAAEWHAEQQRLLDWLQGPWSLLRRAVRSAPPTLETLPEPIRARYFTRAGQPLGFLYPADDVFDATFLDAYVAGSLRVDPEVTGFPRVFHKMAGRITGGFYRAIAVGSLLVALILWVDFRNLRDACLALLPLAMGVLWMLGAMRLLGLHFNFANLVAVPLIIGVGIDNGVHVIHRVRLEGARGMATVLRHTGRAILIASLTTMIGFGSLSLASHRGIASLGVVLLLGVGSCLVTSTVVLPNLLVALGVVAPGGDDGLS